MLTADLIRFWKKGPYVGPNYLRTGSGAYLQLAQELIGLFTEHKGRSKGELLSALKRHLAESPDYLIHRGLSKLLFERAEFSVVTKSGQEPRALRERLFHLSAENHPLALRPSLSHPVTREDILVACAEELRTDPEALLHDLYADLPERHVMVAFDPPTPEWLLNRYNVALAQGLLYRCTRMRIIAYRNLPARYKQLFKFIKFFRLLHAITGDLESGYEITLDGPLSLFRLTRKYGLHLAGFFPALLLCTRWRMEAEILLSEEDIRSFVMASDDHPLASHYQDLTRYDSLLEETFAERFERLQSDWILERETEIVNLKDTVFIPDFAFRHKKDGRRALLEIVGFWRSDYLQRKLEKLKRAGLKNLVVAVSENLKADQEAFKALPGAVCFFKTTIDPKEVLKQVEQVAE